MSKPVFRCSSVAEFNSLARNGYLTEKQRADMQRLLDKPKLTSNQQDTLNSYIKRKDIQPELAETAQKSLRRMWLEQNKGYYADFDTLATLKGTKAEEDAITLLSITQGRMFVKNTERKTVEFKNYFISGECDIDDEEEDTIWDTKCSVSPETFMGAKMNKNYFGQGQFYMYLWNRKRFKLAFCLVDAPPSIYERMYYRFCREHDIMDDMNPEYAPLIDRFNNTVLFSNNPNYSPEERVKIYTIERDDDYIEKTFANLDVAAKMYSNFKLNIEL